MLLPTTLSLGAAALLINFWLAMRCGKVRTTEKIIVRRRRQRADDPADARPAQFRRKGAGRRCCWSRRSNWPARAGRGWRRSARLFLLGRVAHAFGMDGAASKPVAAIGMLTGMVLQLSPWSMVAVLVLRSGKFVGLSSSA